MVKRTRILEITELINRISDLRHETLIIHDDICVLERANRWEGKVKKLILEFNLCVRSLYWLWTKTETSRKQLMIAPGDRLINEIRQNLESYRLAIGGDMPCLISEKYMRETAASLICVIFR